MQGYSKCQIEVDDILTIVSSKEILATNGEENEKEDAFVDWLKVTSKARNYANNRIFRFTRHFHQQFEVTSKARNYANNRMFRFTRHS